MPIEEKLDCFSLKRASSSIFIARSLSFKPTPEQEKAISHYKGNLQIIARAGSGKTEVVSRRIAELVKKGATPKSIVARAIIK